MPVKNKEEVNTYNRSRYQRVKERDGDYYKETRQSYYEKNKQEYAERSKNWYSDSANKIKLREKKFGINFQELIDKQNNRCGICSVEFTDYSQVHIDHDHETNLVRGLLCKQHNRGLGFFADNWELLEKASEWVFKGKVRHLNGS